LTREQVLELSIGIFLIGGTDPAIVVSSSNNPLIHVRVIQTIYPSLVPQGIVDCIQNCNHPRGLINITVEDAKKILFCYKEAFENSWTKGWDNEDLSEVKFVGFFDGKSFDSTVADTCKSFTLVYSHLGYCVLFRSRGCWDNRQALERYHA
jgi:hypothetical protein